MSISNVSSTDPGVARAAGGAASLAGATAEEQGARFMRLFLAQLSNQDPLKPMDNAQLTSQLAQLSTVSGIERMNKSLESMATTLAAGQLVEATGMVGRSVLTKGTDLQLAGGQAAFQVSLPASADTVKVQVLDAAANVVRTIDLGAQAPGQVPVRWDGSTDAGGRAADGTYRLKVVANNAGRSVAADSLVHGQVASVSQGQGQGLTIQLASGRTVSLADVRQLQ